MKRSPARRRRGLTLFEIVVAMGILLVGITALYKLITDASYKAARVNFKAQASLRCQSKLAEVTIGEVGLDSTDFQSFADDANWQWRLQSEMEANGLYRVCVEVQRQLPTGEIIQASLSQHVLDPYIRGSSLDVASTTSSSSSSSSKSGMTETAPTDTGAATAPATTPTAPAATPMTPAATPMAAPKSTTPTTKGGKG